LGYGTLDHAACDPIRRPLMQPLAIVFAGMLPGLARQSPARVGAQRTDAPRPVSPADPGSAA
jgi:hypothetical protein